MNKIFRDTKYNSSDIKFIKKIIIPSLLRVHLFLLLLFHYYASIAECRVKINKLLLILENYNSEDQLSKFDEQRHSHYIVI